MGKVHLCGFTEFAPVKHYIAKERMTVKWFTRRYFYEGITQYHRFGISEYLKTFTVTITNSETMFGNLYI